MRKIIITFLVVFITLSAFSQTQSDNITIQKLQQSIRQLQADLRKQKADLKKQKMEFARQLSEANDIIALLRSEIEIGKKNTAIIADTLGIQIINTKTDAAQQIQDVHEKISKNTLYWIIAVLSIALLSIVLFVWLRKTQKSDKIDLIAQLTKTKSSIEESLIKDFCKQAESMDGLLDALKQLKTNVSTHASTEIDHSLVLKVADEITLMERNITLMDNSTKGLKQLNRSIGKLKDNLAVNGYEIPELLGKPYNEGLKVIVINSVYDENLQKDEKVISKIIKPQVNYNDKMIQAAQIELNVG